MSSFAHIGHHSPFTLAWGEGNNTSEEAVQRSLGAQDQKSTGNAQHKVDEHVYLSWSDKAWLCECLQVSRALPGPILSWPPTNPQFEVLVSCLSKTAVFESCGRGNLSYLHVSEAHLPGAPRQELYYSNREAFCEVSWPLPEIRTSGSLKLSCAGVGLSPYIHFRTDNCCQCRSLIPPLGSAAPVEAPATALAPNKTPVTLAEQNRQLSRPGSVSSGLATCRTSVFQLVVLFDFFTIA